MKAFKLLVALAISLTLIGSASAMGLAGSTFGKGPSTLSGFGPGSSFSNAAVRTTGSMGFMDAGGNFNYWTPGSFAAFENGNLNNVITAPGYGYGYSSYAIGSNSEAAASLNSGFNSIGFGSGGGIRGMDNGMGGSFGNGPL